MEYSKGLQDWYVLDPDQDIQDKLLKAERTKSKSKPQDYFKIIFENGSPNM